jgi:hypothetical protein
MTGQIMSIIIGAIIVYLAARALWKSISEVKAGECAGCSGDCSACGNVMYAGTEGGVVLTYEAEDYTYGSHGVRPFNSYCCIWRRI